MIANIKNFTDLNAWQEAHEVALYVYKLTTNFPRREMFGLVDQMRRVAISVTSNIAEGFGRFSYKEKTRFYYMASGSLSELKNQIIISKDLGYIKDKEYAEIDLRIDTAYKLLHGLISKTKSFYSAVSDSYIQSPVSNL